MMPPPLPPVVFIADVCEPCALCWVVVFNVAQVVCDVVAELPPMLSDAAVPVRPVPAPLNEAAVTDELKVAAPVTPSVLATVAEFRPVAPETPSVLDTVSVLSDVAPVTPSVVPTVAAPVTDSEPRVARPLFAKVPVFETAPVEVRPPVTIVTAPFRRVVPVT